MNGNCSPNSMIEETINYIKSFLTYGDEQAAKQIGYTSDQAQWSNYRVVILPNGHFGKDIVYPTMDAIRTVKQGKTYIIENDIIYTVFFFISRAEELIVSERDEHGRFLAKHSILGQYNNLQIPLLDEYARGVMKMLELPLPQTGYAHIYLTHDIDTIAFYRHLRGFIGGWLTAGMDAVLDSIENIKLDPAYTFPWLVRQDKTIQEAQSIYFVKHTRGKGYDYPQYKLYGLDWKRLKAYLKRNKAELGLHSSYYGDIINPEHYTLHRSHFLRCDINQMQRLADSGITDDFTMGFADQAGFRLQTTRAVRWINPLTFTLSSLTLHPLTVMDCTLSNENYMHLTEDEAYFLCEQLFSKVKMHHGDLCLLWHNSILTPDSYHRSLYPKILNLLNGQ